MQPAAPEDAPIHRKLERVEIVLGFHLRRPEVFGMRSGDINVAMWSEPRDSSTASFLLGDKPHGVPHLYKTPFGHFFNCAFEAFGMASTMPPDESGAARACWVKNVMLHFVDGGQSVFHGYPMAYRFFEQADGGWSRWYGNEIFLKSLDTSDWQSLPKPPPLWLPGQAVKEGAVMPDPHGRLMDAAAFASSQLRQVFLKDRMPRCPAAAAATDGGEAEGGGDGGV